MKKKTYKLIRSASFGISGLTAIGMTVGVLEKTENIPNYKKTVEDISYEKVLEELENSEEEIVFENQELLEYIKSVTSIEEINKETLSSIELLMIDEELSNQNFTDLKYFPNLTTLSIYNNDINLDDLYYNSKLTNLIIANGTVKNTASVPNSVARLEFTDVTITDGHLIIPYFTTSVIVKNCTFEDLYFENPDILEYFEMEGNEKILDLAQFTNNTKLKRISIKNCYNVKNSQILKDINSLEEVILDASAVCWMDLDTLNNIPYECNIPGPDLMLRIAALNEVEKEIISDEGIENPEKIERILTYVKENINIQKDCGYSSDSTIFFKTSSFMNEEQITVKIYCHETSSNYLVAALARIAGVDVLIEIDDNQRVYITAEGIKVDVSRYVKGENLLNTQMIEEENIETRNMEDNDSRGPLSLYYEKEYKININDLTENQRKFLISLGCVGLLSLFVSQYSASIYRKKLEEFMYVIDKSKWDIKENVVFKSFEKLQKEINDEYEALSEEITKKLKLISPISRKKWSRAKIEENLSERYQKMDTMLDETEKQTALENQKFADYLDRLNKIKVKKEELIKISQYTTPKPISKKVSLPTFPLDEIHQNLKKGKEQEREAREELQRKAEETKIIVARQLAYHKINNAVDLTTKRVKNNLVNNFYLNRMGNAAKVIAMPKQLPKATIIVSEIPNRTLSFGFENKKRKNQKMMDAMVKEAQQIIAAKINSSTSLAEKKTREVNFVLLGSAKQEKIEEQAQVVVTEKALPMVILPKEVEALMAKAKEQAGITPTTKETVEIKTKELVARKKVSAPSGNTAGKSVTKIRNGLPMVILSKEIKENTNEVNFVLVEQKEKKEIKKVIAQAQAVETKKALPMVILPDEVEALMAKAKEQAMLNKEILTTPKEKNSKQEEKQNFPKMKFGKDRSYLNYEKAITTEFIKPLYEQTKAKIEEQAKIKVKLARKARYEARKKKLMQPTMSMQEVLANVKANISILKDKQKDTIEQLQKETQAKECLLPRVILPNEIERIKEEARMQVERNNALKEEIVASFQREVENAKMTLSEKTASILNKDTSFFQGLNEKISQMREQFNQEKQEEEKVLEKEATFTKLKTSWNVLIKAKHCLLKQMNSSLIVPDATSIIKTLYEKCEKEQQEAENSKLIEEQEVYYSKLNEKLQDSYEEFSQSVNEGRKINVTLWDLNHNLLKTMRQLKDNSLKIVNKMKRNSKDYEEKQKKLPSTKNSTTTFSLASMNQEMANRIELEKKYAELEIKTQAVMLNNERNLRLLDLTCKAAEKVLAVKSEQSKIAEETKIENGPQEITMSLEVLKGLIQFFLSIGIRLNPPTCVFVDATQQPETVGTTQQQRKAEEIILEEKPIIEEAVLENGSSSSMTNLISSSQNISLLESLEIKINAKEDSHPIVEKKEENISSLEQSNNPSTEKTTMVEESKQEAITLESETIIQEKNHLEEIQNLRKKLETIKAQYAERKKKLTENVETDENHSIPLKEVEEKAIEQPDKEKLERIQRLHQRQEELRKQYLARKEQLAGKGKETQEEKEEVKKEVIQEKYLETTQEISASDEDKLKEIAQMTQNIRKIMETLRQQKRLREETLERKAPVFRMNRHGSM